MLKPRQPPPTEAPLPFALDPTPLSETLTAFGGAPLVVQAFRSLGLPGHVQREVQVKTRQRGYDEATFVESFVVLQAVGGECLDDFTRNPSAPRRRTALRHRRTELAAHPSRRATALSDSPSCSSAHARCPRASNADAEPFGRMGMPPCDLQSIALFMQ
jgi:hypothetical protein